MDPSDILKSLRGKKLKTQDSVANIIGVSRQMYCGYENNVMQCSLDLIYKILNALEATEEEVNSFFDAITQDNLSYKK